MRKKAYLAALGYSLFIGVSFIIMKTIVDDVSPILLLAHRFTIALIVYSIYLLFNKRNFHLTLNKFFNILPITLLYPIFFFILQIFGIESSSSSEAGIIFALVPIITIIIASILGCRPSKVQIISIVLSVSGVLLIFSNNFVYIGSSYFGTLLLLLASVSFSLYTLNIKRVLDKVSLPEFMFTILLSGFVIFNIMSLIETGIYNDYVNYFISPFKNSEYTLSILYLGVMASFIATSASNYALKYLSAPKFSVFANLSTLISIATGAIILNENLTLFHYAGSLLILIGVFGTNFHEKITLYFLEKFST